MEPGDRVFIQWEPDDIVYDVIYEKTERGFFIFRGNDGNRVVARKDALSHCEVQENGNDQRNLRETPETILSGTL